MLTETRSKTAKPRPEAYKLADPARSFLLVVPGGGKLWRWNDDYDGRAETMALGAWPFVSLADARAKRDEAHAILNEGRDPSVVRKLAVEANIEAGRQAFERVTPRRSPSS